MQLAPRTPEAQAVELELPGWLERRDASGIVEAAGDGVLALLSDRTLAWALPAGPRGGAVGRIRPAEVNGWIVGPETMELRYRPAPVKVHYHNPPRVVEQLQPPAVLHLRAHEPDEIPGFIEAVRGSAPFARGIIRPG